MDEKMSGFRGGGGGGAKCGRWNPTSEQVNILTDLFRSGLRTPSTDQIQKISSQLSFYGKIESKNVFYWFQNHKARERQKRRRVYVDHDQNDLNVNLDQDKISSTKQQVNNDEIFESKRAIETLQLFPLNSLDYSDELENQRKENAPPYATAYTCGTEMDIYHHHHPTLDLRLSFM